MCGVRDDEEKMGRKRRRDKRNVICFNTSVFKKSHDLIINST